MTVDEAYDRICKAIDAGRPANGYLVVGGVRGLGGELADRVLRHLYGGEADLAAHPDIHRLAPEKKSRIISVEAMRQRLIAPMEMTSYQGGWKAGVVLGADRLKAEAANAFLKTLEEPPKKTLFLLLTERPEQLLPTIISRCQRVDLPDARARLLDEPWRERVIDILSAETLKGQTAAEGKGRGAGRRRGGRVRRRRGRGGLEGRGGGARLVALPRVPERFHRYAHGLVPRPDGPARGAALAFRL